MFGKQSQQFENGSKQSENDPKKDTKSPKDWNRQNPSFDFPSGG